MDWYGFTLEELTELLTKISKLNDSIIIDINVIEKENCYPMVAPGRSNSQMLGLEEQKRVEIK